MRDAKNAKENSCTHTQIGTYAPLIFVLNTHSMFGQTLLTKLQVILNRSVYSNKWLLTKVKIHDDRSYAPTYP
jgi:hypothetical protein